MANLENINDIIDLIGLSAAIEHFEPNEIEDAYLKSLWENVRNTLEQIETYFDKYLEEN